MVDDIQPAVKYRWHLVNHEASMTTPEAPKDGQTYWIQWTFKDETAVLWAYDPEAGKAVEILQVRDK